MSNALLREFGLTTPEAIAAFKQEFQKAVGGDYGYHDMLRGRLVTKDEAAGIKKDATNNLGVTTPLGLLGVPLEAPAKLVYAVPTPLRNRLPRETVGGASITFRKITGINTTNVWGGVAEATDSTTGRNGRIAYNEVNTTYNFKSIETETMLTPEALFGSNSKITPGQDFQAEDVARLTLLHATMLAEEKMLLGGNVTALGNVSGISKTSPVALTQAATGVGSLTAATTYYFSVDALTLQGYLNPTKGNGGADAIGETQGVEQSIATATGGTAGDKTITFQWTAIPGAVAYAVYAGSSTGVANHKFVGVFTTNVASVSAIPGSGNKPNTADTTARATDYDGLVAQCCKTAFAPGYYLALPQVAAGSATLTSDSTGGVNEIDVAFKAFYDTYKIGPDELWVPTDQKKKIDQISTASSAPVYRIDVQAGNLNIAGSLGVRSVMNRYMGKETPVTVHPFLPAGTILFVSYGLGPYYAGANVGDNVKVFLGWDYRSITFGLSKRAVEMGMDLNGALVVYGNFALGAIQCIA
jgi:hypothetical protein